jgi:oligoribonuclease
MDEHMVWIDLEMTGLDIESCSIIEIATVITDGDLNIIATGPNLAIQTSEENLAAMDEWNTTHHNASGLVARIRKSEYSIAEAEVETLKFIRKYVAEGKAPLCGNSIWCDRKFIERQMPELAAYLHYRMVDVSSFKEMAKRWYPTLPRYEKKGAHLALDDILESIEELRYFRENIFIQD